MNKDIDFGEFGLKPPAENSEDFILKLISVASKTISLNAGVNWIDGIEVLGQFLTPQLEKSRREWELQVFCALKELNKRQEGILKRLYNDQEFQSILRQAFIISLKTHKKEKFLALKAGLMNTAIDSSISFDKKEIYLRLIDELTATHLIIVNFIDTFKTQITDVDSFEKFFNILNKGTIDMKLPAIDSSIELSTFRAIMKDLENRGLILISPELNDIDGVRKKGESLLAESDERENKKLPFVAVTKHGKEFLAFIKEPI